MQYSEMTEKVTIAVTNAVNNDLISSSDARLIQAGLEAVDAALDAYDRGEGTLEQIQYALVELWPIVERFLPELKDLAEGVL